MLGRKVPEESVGRLLAYVYDLWGDEKEPRNLSETKWERII